MLLVFHNVHYYASLLIMSGLDVKVVQTRTRHSSAKTTLYTLWLDSDDTTRAAISRVIAARAGVSGPGAVRLWGV